MNTEQLRTRLAKYDVAGPRYTSYPTVPYWEDTPSESQWLERVGNALGGGSAAGHGAAIYVHVPFCRALCTFCGCNTRVTRTHAIVAPYVQAMLTEYALYRERLGVAAGWAAAREQRDEVVHQVPQESIRDRLGLLGRSLSQVGNRRLRNGEAVVHPYADAVAGLEP